MNSIFPQPTLPKMFRVRQRLDSRRIEDVERDTFEKLRASNLNRLVKPGNRIAITAGSRGMGGFAGLLRGIIAAVKSCGGEPFLVPAMGSHGGATAQGQEELLHRLGIKPDEIGAQIQATMETVCLGKCETGAEAHFDAVASQCDGVIVLGRVKTHPENTEGIASGLLKMVTVGLGKQVGAREAHSHGLWESVQAVPKLSLGTGKVLLGVAVVENAFREPAVIEVVPGDYERFYEADSRLLKIAQPYTAKIPFDTLDVLVVDEIGKNISGTGMDLNVIGPWRIKGGEKHPDYKRIVALSLTEGSLGNGLGIGLADFTTKRFVERYDASATMINMLTATEPNARNTIEAGLPTSFENDRAAVEAALYSSLARIPRVCRIRNTAALDEFMVSESLLGEAEKKGLELVGSAEAWNFDRQGNLAQ